MKTIPSATADQQVLEALCSQVEQYALCDEPGTEYTIWHNFPLSFVTRMPALWAAFGSRASFRFALCRNGRPVMLYKLSPEQGQSAREKPVQLFDSPLLLRFGLPVLPQGKKNWPSLAQAVSAQKEREKSAAKAQAEGPTGRQADAPAKEQARAQAEGLARRPWQNELSMLDPACWPVLAAKGLLSRPDSPDLTGFGRAYERAGRLLTVDGPCCPDAPEGKKWPRNLCCPAWVLKELFPARLTEAERQARLDEEDLLWKEEHSQPDEEGRLPLDERFRLLCEYGATAPRHFLHAADWLMKLPFRKFALISGGCFSGSIVEAMKTADNIREQDERICSFAVSEDGRQLSYLEAIRKLDALLTAQEKGQPVGPVEPRQLLCDIAHMYEWLHCWRLRRKDA